MATRAVLAELAAAYSESSGQTVFIESVGGVDAAKRVAAGEFFDLVFLAADAIAKLVASGHILAGSQVNLMYSGVAVAVRRGDKQPDISTEAALRKAVRNAPSVSISTGPSGVALARLFEQWGIAREIAPRLVQAPPGVPVGTLIARGEVALGFQQHSEMMHLDGIDVIGPLPPTVQITTTFSGGVCATSIRRSDASTVLAYLAGPSTSATKRRQGMEPA